MSAKCVFVVDDDAFYAHCLKRLFQSSGMDCLHVNGNDAVVDMARKEKPDMILLSLLFCGNDGFEILSSLKTDPACQNIPVAMLAHVGMKEDVDRSWERGACAYIIKSQQGTEEWRRWIRKLHANGESGKTGGRV